MLPIEKLPSKKQMTLKFISSLNPLDYLVIDYNDEHNLTLFRDDPIVVLCNGNIKEYRRDSASRYGLCSPPSKRK